MRRGWSLEDLAAAVIELGRNIGEGNLALTAKTVGRWERGESKPRAPYPKLLCMLFKTSAQDLGLHRSSCSGSGFQRLAVENDMERRTILGLLGAALVAPALRADYLDAFDGLERVAGRRGTDTEGVGIIEGAIGNCRRLDDRFGSAAAARLALAQRTLVYHLHQSSHPASIQLRLCSATAQLGQLLGWLAFDMNDHSTARAYYHEGLKAAQEAGEHELIAYILGHVAVLAVSDEKLSEGLAVIDAPNGRTARAASPTMRSWFAAVEAEIQALAGNAKACLHALERAQGALGQAKAVEEVPPWLYYFDWIELLTYEGACYEQIGRLDEARSTWQAALASLDPSLVRDRAIYLTHLASTYVRQGEIEEACRLAAESLTIALETGSSRSLERVQKLREQLEPWKATQAVGDLDRQLSRASDLRQRKLAF